MRRSAAPALALTFAVLAGCLGNDRTFPDESDQVTALHVNAFEPTTGDAPRPAIVQVSGLGPDGQERAFRGDVHVELERAVHPEKDVQYASVKSYDERVNAQGFSSATVPFWTFTIAPADLPGAATYRVNATARIPGHEAMNASALFAYVTS